MVAFSWRLQVLVVDLSLYLAMAGNARYNWDRTTKKIGDSEINFAMLRRLGARLNIGLNTDWRS